MTQEDKDILLKDLCARLPYGVKVQDELGRINKLVIGNADLIRLYYNDFSIYSEKQISLPLLRPMSSMTEEEKRELGTEVNKLIFDAAINAPQGYNIQTCASDVFFIGWLNSHHFDYRGLIEKGLAIEAPEGMYE